MNMFRGLYTALITPFTSSGEIDFVAASKILEYQIENGVDGVVICGTTGESATLSESEQDLLIKHAVKTVNKRIKVVAGTGSNCTIKAVRLTQKAQEAGVDGALIVAPYYSKPTQEGIFEHYKAINNSCNLPIILYNVPGRTVCNIADETTTKLAELKNIVSIKDATGDLARVYTLQDAMKNANLLDDKEFTILSGEDMTAVSFNASGGDGLISVTSNIMPKHCSIIQGLCQSGDFYSANEMQKQITKLNDIMFMQSNPIVVKYAMHLLGLCTDYVRLPLTKPSAEIIDLLKKEMKLLELIK